jgi:hypothetical protein
MKTRLLTVLAVGLLLGARAARADEQADAKALLDKAMKAMSGETKLAKLGTASVKCKVTGSEGGQEITMDLDGVWRGLSQYRLDATVQVGGRTIQGVLVFNDDKAWFKAPCKTEDAPEGVASFLQNALHAMRMPQLLPSLTGKDYKLSLLGEVTVGSRAALGLSVSHKDRKDVSLFFDKENGLPLKSEVRLTDPKGKEITVEYHYSDYKEFDGVKLCGKITIKVDDKEFTMELSELKAVEKVEDSQFDKP